MAIATPKQSLYAFAGFGRVVVVTRTACRGERETSCRSRKRTFQSNRLQDWFTRRNRLHGGDIWETAVGRSLQVEGRARLTTARGRDFRRKLFARKLLP